MSNWIVVVDDEALSLTSAKSLLGSEDMRVSCLRSGQDLLKFMEKNDPDLILLDVMMPEMDGFDTFEALRRQEKKDGRLETPVIFLTGDQDDKSEQKGLKLGASDYIRKPFNKDLLIRRITNAISNSKKIETLTENATIDKLTGLLNRASGEEKISQVCGSEDGVLIILDLDNFKLVNDLFGHDVGDLFLKAFADILRNNTRSEDVVSRIGGDEFLAFFSNVNDEESVGYLTTRLNDQMVEEAARLMGSDHGIPLGISVGGVMVPQCGSSYEELFRLADEALYDAKHNGKHRSSVYKGGGIRNDEALTPAGELERLSQILAERSEVQEALLLGMEPFSAVYHFIIRFNKRYGGHAAKVLIVLSQKEDSGKTMDEIMSSFGELLKRALRKCDIILKYKSDQYLVILPMPDEPDPQTMIERVLKKWEDYPEYNCCDVEYSIDDCL